MNKTMTMVAVILSVITAVFLVNIMDGTDGAVPAGYVKISDADAVCYTDDTLPGTNIYITSSAIKAEAFKDCTTIVNVILTDDVKTIGDNAFDGCTGLKYVSAPGVTSIGNGCFKSTGKATFEFTSFLKTVGSNAFEGCKGLGPYLMGTEVTQLKSGTFKDSKVRFEDLRGVTSIADDAFANCTLKGQIVEGNQTVKVAGVPEITFENAYITGLAVTTLVSGSNKLFFITGGSDVVLKFTDSSGTTTVTSVYNTYGFNCEYVFKNTDLKVGGASWNIHFPADSGIDDEIHLAGEGTYTIPYPALASNLFKSWSIQGESSSRTEITEAEFRNLDADIYLIAAYNMITVTYDHSALPGSSGLATSGTFTVGDSYPSLPNTLGYSFSGWYVGSKFYAGGDKIVTYRDHTAISAWNATTFDVSIVSQGSIVATKTVEANSALILSELSVTVPESKILMGWSLQENGGILTDDPVINKNCSIYAVLKDKAQHTVRYLDDQTVLASTKVYDGSTFRIEQDNPVKEGKNFQNWELGDTGNKYYKGESITVTGDIDLRAAWLNIQHTVKYVLDQAYTFTYDYGTEVVIGYSGAVKNGYELQGWSTTSTGNVQYHNGDKVTLKDDIMLFPIWKETTEPTSSTGTQPSDEVPRTPSSTPETTDPGTPTESTPTGPSSDSSSGSSSSSTSDSSSSSTSDSSTGTSTGSSGAASEPTTGTQPGSSSNAPSGDTRDTTTPSQTTAQTTRTIYKLKLMNGYNEFDSYSVDAGTFDLSTTGVPVQEGCKFLGWSKSSSDKTPRYTSSSSILVQSDTTLYAVWEKLMKVTYHDDTGTFNDTVYCEKNGSISLREMSRAGFVFKGWSENGSNGVLNGNVKVSKDLDLYPQWEQIAAEEITTPPIPETEKPDTGITDDPPAISEKDSKPSSTTEDKDPVKTDEPASSGSNGDSNTMLIAVGAAVAAAISIVVFVQFRRA